MVNKTCKRLLETCKKLLSQDLGEGKNPNEALKASSLYPKDTW